jgi:arginine:ornithine antiporter/lysine permease
MRFRQINILDSLPSPREYNGKETGPQRLDRTGTELNAGRRVFSLPQNMAAVASPSALLIGWAITGVGILFLAFAMLLLTRIRADLDGGIFTYAREGFGELVGFAPPGATGCAR